MKYPLTTPSARTKNRLSTFLIVGLLLAVGGCGSKVSKFVSTFFPFKGKPPRGYALVPGGSLTIGLTGDHTSLPRTVSVNSFYVKETCITNEEYKIYLERLREVYLDQGDDDAKRRYEEAKPNGDVWKRPLAYHDSYIKGYSELERFKDFPAVVTWDQAKNFCDFLTEELREMEEEDTDDDDQKDADEDSAKEEKSFASGYRLLSEGEWEVMAMGIAGAQDDEWQEVPRRYPWNGHSLRDDRGEFRATFKRGKGDYKGPPGERDNSAPTDKVDAHPPNDLGVYLYCGVCEWVADVYRPQQCKEEDLNPYRRDGTLDPAEEYDAKHSLINDDARVYKGCSWKDPAIYLEIGRRRYADKKEPIFCGFRPVYYGEAGI